MTARKMLLGAAAGLTWGYATVRAAQAVRELRAPAPPRAERDAKRYAAERRALTIAGTLRGVAALGADAFLFADPLEAAVRPLPRPLRVPVFALVLLAIERVRDLGVDFVDDHARERIWGTTEQTPGSWLADQAKGFAVAAVVTSLLVALADAVVVRAPRRWPLLAIAATPPLLAFATVIAPTFVLPLFNRYEPVTGELERAIRALATRYGVGDAAILRFDMSKQTTKANAFVTGVLGTERIVLGDTLIENFAGDETLFVVAHELGHYVRRDPWSAIAVGTGAVAITVLGANAALRAATGRGVDGPAQGARLAFFAALLQLTLMPAANAFSRAVERRADRFALAATGDPAAGARAFRRLGEQNLADLEPPRWAQLLFGSHPTLAERIGTLEAAG